MGVKDVGSLSLGQWIAICRQWNRAHGKEEVSPPTVEEFEAAMLAARGVD